MNEHPIEIFFFGPGKLGLSLCLLFERAGIETVGVWGRREASLKEAERRVRSPLFHGPIPDEVSRANVVFITTQDEAIEEVARKLAESGHLSGGVVVYHCSGAFDSRILTAVRRSGAIPGTIHPLQAVPTVEEGLEALPRSYFALEGDERAVSTGRVLVKAIGGSPFEQAVGNRGLYHAAAAMASNYMITLLWSAVRMMANTGLTEEEAARVLQPMVKHVIGRIDEIGIRKALTGPIVRGDERTLKIQLEAVAEDHPNDLPLFIALALRTIDLVKEIGDVDEERIGRMRDLLNGFETTIM